MSSIGAVQSHGRVETGAPVFDSVRVSNEFLAYRLSTETFLRGLDLLNDAVDGNIAHGMLLNALWCLELAPGVPPKRSLILPGEWSGPMSIHDLARALALPYSTVHRQLRQLTESGLAVRTGGGATVIAPDFLQSAAGRTFRQRSIASFVRLMLNLHRIGYLTGNVGILERENGMTTQQEDVVFRTGMETLLSCLLLTARFFDDLVTGLVFKLVATANVKQLTNAPHTLAMMSSGVPDELRRPISVYNVARALHMPYETTRRIAKHLIQRNIFKQANGCGVFVPCEVHRQTDDADAQRASFQALAAGVAQMEYAGLKLRLQI
jgi:DNA-binding transcriptional regulator YhcF (GntR family)